MSLADSIILVRYDRAKLDYEMSDYRRWTLMTKRHRVIVTTLTGTALTWYFPTKVQALAFVYGMRVGQLRPGELAKYSYS